MMSDQVIIGLVIIVLIIAVAVVIVLVVFRDKLSHFVFKTKMVDANLEIPINNGIKITGTRQRGKGNKIKVARRNVNITGLKQNGEYNKLKVKKE